MSLSYDFKYLIDVENDTVNTNATHFNDNCLQCYL
jgi:hypothetical protein